MQPMNDSAPTKPPAYRWAPALILSLTALYVLFFRLGERGFENKDTLWYVEIAWEMLRSGDWVVPRFNTVIFTEKPILFIWCVSFFSWLAGEITPFTARLPSALAALGCVGLTCSLGNRIFSHRAGLLAGFILCTSYAFAWEARTCMVDMLFTFFVTWALYLFWRGLGEGFVRKRQFILMYIASGLAALTKGPLGVAFLAIVLLVYLVWARRLRWLRHMAIPWGILIIAGIQAAWYLPYLWRIGPEGRRFFLEMYVYKENLLRFTTGFDKPEPFWFYVPAFLTRFLPWSPFLVLWPFLRREGAAERDYRFPLAWFLGLFAILTISTGKHSRYALPLYPAAALLVADFWDRLMESAKHPLESFVPSLIAVVAVCAAAGFPVFVFYTVPALWYASLAASILLLSAAVSLFMIWGPVRLSVSFAAVVFAFCCGWGAYILSLPAHDERRAEHEQLALDVEPFIGGETLITYGPTEDKFGRRLALGFFLGRPVIYIDREEDLSDYLRSGRRLFFLMQKEVYEDLLRRRMVRARPVGPFRYRRMDLVLIESRGGHPG